MFRKSLAAILALFLLMGGLFAEDFKGVFKKYQDGKATFEVDGKTVEYRVSKDAKFKTKKGGEILLTEVFSVVKEGIKGTITVEDGVITKVMPDAKSKKKPK